MREIRIVTTEVTVVLVADEEGKFADPVRTWYDMTADWWDHADTSAVLRVTTGEWDGLGAPEGEREIIKELNEEWKGDNKEGAGDPRGPYHFYGEGPWEEENL